jgi:site-specific DNA-methyltransferase (adenine-specific)/adenine-specific DNA-methyltransferase
VRAERVGGRADRTRIELIWPGKLSGPAAFVIDGPIPDLWLQERYPDRGPDLAGVDAGWRDLLIGGDNVPVLRALLAEPWRNRIEAAGGLRLVYLDPPFLTGQDFVAEVRVGEAPGRGVCAVAKGGNRARSGSGVALVPAFRDAGPRDLPAYLSAMRARLTSIRDLLADDGSLYLHCDHRLSAYLRLLLDEVFGPDRFVNEIVWHYGLGNPGGARTFARKHDTILLYAKTDRYRFHRLRGEVTRAMADKYRHEDEHGRYMLAYGRKYRLKGGKPLDSVWEIPTLAATDGERLGYPTQKPEALLERIVRASSDPGDLVADFCCGCGTLPAVATRLGRRWLACDAGRLAIHLTRKRLLGLGDRLSSAGQQVPGFDVLALEGHRPEPSLDYDARIDAEIGADHGRPIVALRGVDFSAPSCEQAALAASLSAGQQALAIADGQLWRIAVDRRGQPTSRRLTRRWSDWLDGWAVGHPVGGGTAAVAWSWHTVRASARQPLPLVSGPIPAGDRPVVVKVFTILGDGFAVELVDGSRGL